MGPGDRAVVVDPGHHHVTSFGTLQIPAGVRLARPRRGVVIRLQDGVLLTVPRRHLGLVAPDHPLAPEPDASAADWWLRALVPWGASPLTVASFVPRTFPAVARILHPGLHGELDQRTATALVAVLGGATSIPGDVFFAVWSGWGDVPPQRFPGAAEIATEARGHFLLRGPLEGGLTSISAAGYGRLPSGIWWPADHAWLVATEIDFEWTFVAGAEALVEELLVQRDLQVNRTSHGSSANRL